MSNKNNKIDEQFLCLIKDDKGIKTGLQINSNSEFIISNFKNDGFDGIGVTNKFENKLLIGTFKDSKPLGICCYKSNDHIYFGSTTLVNNKINKSGIGFELYDNGDWILASYQNNEKVGAGFYFKNSENAIVAVPAFDNSIINGSMFRYIKSLKNVTYFPNININFVYDADYMDISPDPTLGSEYIEEYVPKEGYSGFGRYERDNLYMIRYYNHEVASDLYPDGLYYSLEFDQTYGKRISIGTNERFCGETPEGEEVEGISEGNLLFQYYDKEDKYILWNPSYDKSTTFTIYKDKIEIRREDFFLKIDKNLSFDFFNSDESNSISGKFEDIFTKKHFHQEDYTGKCFAPSDLERFETDFDDSDLEPFTEEERKKLQENKEKLLEEESLQEEKERTLDDFVGLNEIKAVIPRIKAYCLKNKKNNEDFKPNLNFAFLGRPGTGKTEIARLLGKELVKAGILKREKVYEYGAKELLHSSYDGNVSTSIIDAFKEAKGAVLFIDEAYGMINFTEDVSEAVNDREGVEAINTLMKCLEDKRGELCVILAGYKDKMQQLFKANQGFESRINRQIEFPDYSFDELKEILNRMLINYRYTMKESVKNRTIDYIKSLSYKKSFGNAREVRNVLEKLIEYQNFRTADNDDYEITDLDIDEFLKNKIQKLFDGKTAKEVLDNLIGLDSVKKELNKIKCFYSSKRTDINTKLKSNLNIQLVGNPGTGKTTVARLIADILYDAKVLPSNTFVEASRDDFVSQWQGKTPKQTHETFEKALGGVLFIDEAYSLWTGPEDDKGAQAIAALLQDMENYKGKICVIMAGYPMEMEYLLYSNSGLKRRIGRTIKFPDYSREELEKILDIRLKEDKKYLDKDARKEILDILDYKHQLPNFGNAGEINNILQSIEEINLVNNNSSNCITLNDVKQYEKDFNININVNGFKPLLTSYEKIKEISDNHDDNSFKLTNSLLEETAVAITVTCGGNISQGSGAIIDENGTIVTNAHVVDDYKKSSITVGINMSLKQGGTAKVYFNAYVSKIGSVHDKDVAILTLDNPKKYKFKYLPLHKEDDPYIPLTPVSMAGYPQGERRFENISFNNGYIQSLNKDSKLHNGIKYLIVDMTGQHGSSGSAVVNRKTGRIVSLFTRVATVEKGMEGITKIALTVPSIYIWEILKSKKNVLENKKKQ